ncbi:MAG: phosphoribosylformylglycinamidine cyclo-ligase [Planctomycetota bacterium]|nr:phosphoribosylformylglycinamidine cyclo-ligase [Planctomycetota bacterium]
MAITYKDAGVDIEQKTQSIKSVTGLIGATHNSNVLTGVGHFGGLFSLAQIKEFDDPVMVASTDGVGTKVEVAVAMNDLSSIGKDIVHHCVNDILCCGARPLFFLDYVGTSKLNSTHFSQLVEGVSEACGAHDCPLIAGETAEMPGVYYDKCLDVVGTISGIVERSRIVDGSSIQAGDVLIGLESEGLHTNGYSLARKVLLSKNTVNDRLGGFDLTIGQELLRVHRSYYSLVHPLLERDGLHGLAHITGGGITDNVARLVPDGLTFRIDWNSWERPSLFKTIQEMGSVPEDDMRHTFNLGIGFILIVAEDQEKAVREELAAMDERTHVMGRIVAP